MITKRFESSNSGFSMIELLVSLIILAIGLLAIVSMQGTAMKGNNLSRSMTQGYYVGQRQMENLIQQGYGAVNNGTTTRSMNDTNITYNINWQVTNNTYTQNVKTINMTVSWSRKGENQNIVIMRSVPEVL